jgi:hypothetical protein
MRLRRVPRSRACFRAAGLDAAAAVALFHRLRRGQHPPAWLCLRREGASGECAVEGAFEGSQAHVRAVAARAGVPQVDDHVAYADLVPAEDRERVDGALPPSRVDRLLAALPAASRVQVAGCGEFQLDATPAGADAALGRLSELGAVARIGVGAAQRRGRSTPRDPRLVALEARVKQSLDPRWRLR